MKNKLKKNNFILVLLLILVVFRTTQINSTSDTTPPTVIRVSPPDGATEVSIAFHRLQVTFSEEMDFTTLTRSNIFLTDSQGNLAPITAVGRGATFFQLVLAELLKESELYTVFVLATVTDKSGNVLDGDGNGVGGDDFTSQFTTESLQPPEFIPPTVVKVSPDDGAGDVSIALRRLQVTFSEEMDFTTLTRSNIFLTDSQGNLAPIAAVGRGATFFQLVLAGLLKEYEVYTVNVLAFVTDKSGNALDGDGNGVAGDDFTSTFTTEALTAQAKIQKLIDEIETLINLGVITSDQTHGLIRHLVIALEKIESEDMQTAYNMLKAFINHVNGFVPTVLPQDEGDSLITQAKDIIAQIYDNVPPTVVKVSPADGAEDVSIALPRVQVTFSEEMDFTTFSTSNIFLKDSQGNLISISAVGITPTTFQLVLSNLLKESEVYTLVVLATVTDLYGNTLDGNSNGIAEGSPTDDFISTFTTETL
jgi:hypothetical protein